MRILLVEDDTDLCEILSFELECEGFQVDVCNDGEESLYYIRQKAYDLILLDQMLPSMPGLKVLETIRKEENMVPVILVTALGEAGDKIKGLDTGADDYIVKPFHTGELMARIRSISRRPQQLQDLSLLTLGDITYYPLEKKIIHEGKTYILTKKEGELLELFLMNPGKILSRALILSRVWGPNAEIEDGNLDNYIYFLRKRLASAHSFLTLSTVRGVGYCLEAEKN
ncbi:MAG: response regulator transcription factor [Anaerocolumna sp.]